MSQTTSTQLQLDQQRRLAVQLRLDGVTLVEATEKSGLSAPTVIAAHKAYLSGGWEAINVKPRGRQAGARQLSPEHQTQLRKSLLVAQPELTRQSDRLWSHQLANQWLQQQGHTMSDRSASAYLEQWGLAVSFPPDALKKSGPQSVVQWLDADYRAIAQQAKDWGAQLYWMGVTAKSGFTLIHAHTTRKKFLWMTHSETNPLADATIDFFSRLLSLANERAVVVLQGIDIARVSSIQNWLNQHQENIKVVFPGSPPELSGEHTDPINDTQPYRPDLKKTPTTRKETIAVDQPSETEPPENFEHNTDLTMSAAKNDPKLHPTGAGLTSTDTLTHLQRLEAESIHIMREVIAEADNPVMMYSVGKDSAVMLHLALKAFYPAKPPFPLLHVDTTWKFRAMYEFRDKIVDELGFELLTHINPDGLAQNVNPFTHGSALHTDIMKTEGLKQALDKHKFDVAFGGARRDEEKSRAKERVFSFRSEQHRWEPKSQRPELWHLYNTRKRPGESIRVFPLSNWTELDIWQYIRLESIPIVPLYLAAERPVVERDGALIMVDDDRMPMQPGEVPMMRKVRFRTLGCYPLTGAVESTATTLTEVIQEMLLTRTSERQGRMIDHDTAASMEKKKQEGYF